MPNQISPGVVTTEIDLSAYVPGVNTTVGAFVGVFRWGPLNEILTLSNEGDLVKRLQKPNLDTATSFFTVARFLSYSNAIRVVRVAAQNSVTISKVVTTVGTALTSTTLLTGTPRIRPGSIVTSGLESRTVLSVQSDTAATLDSAFTADLTAATVAVAIYAGALNATAEEGTGTAKPGIGVLIKNSVDYESNFANGLANVGAFAARCPGAMGNSIEVSLCPSANAYKQTLTGTVSSSGLAVTGIGTTFLSTVIPGTILRDVVSGQERQVTAIADDTHLTVDAAFSPTLSGATLTAKWEFADAIGIAPGTSSFVLNKSGANDQLHIVVVDRGGDFTGIPGTVLERHQFLSKASDAKDEDGTSNFYAEKLNRRSSSVYWTDHIPAGVNWGSPASGTTFTAVNVPTTLRLTGGTDANTGSDIDAQRNLGLDLFADAESVDISLILCGEAPAEVILHAIAIAEDRGDCIALVSPRKDDVVDAPGDEAANVIAFRDTLTASSYGVMNSQWLNVYDKYRDTFVWIPDNGDIGGIIARSDTQTFPWISPAGYNRGVLKEVVKLAWSPKKANRDDLYSAYVNFIVSQTGSGPVWIGDKTMLNQPSAFDRINVRRLFIVLRKSISIIAKGILFETNDSITQNQFKNSVTPFLRTVQARRGIYKSLVVCDSTNNTSEVLDTNEFVADIYISPAKSINFITLNFIATRSGVSFNELVGQAA